MWSVTFFGHNIDTECIFWSEIGQVLDFLLGLIDLVIAYDQDIIDHSLAIAIYYQYCDQLFLCSDGASDVWLLKSECTAKDASTHQWVRLMSVASSARPSPGVFLRYQRSQRSLAQSS